MTPTTWGEDKRLELAIHHALEDATNRVKQLKGKNRRALQQEFYEWTEADDIDEIDVSFTRQYQQWE